MKRATGGNKARSGGVRGKTKAVAARDGGESGGSDTAVTSVAFVSLGCPKNLVDSEKMLGLLAQDGIVPVSYDPGGGAAGEDAFEGADAVVVNTCGFLEASKEESLGVIQEAIRAKERGEVKRVVVAGCLVQRHRAKMLEWAPGIDSMIGVFDRDRIVEAVRGGASETALESRGARAQPLDTDQPKYWVASNALVAARERGLKTTGLTVNGKDGQGIGYFEDDSARLRLTPRHYAYLRISEGCNQNCAFCTIPSIRGKMRSKPLERIVEEARELVRDGAFEISLIGQDTTSYGDDIGIGLGGSRSTPHPSPLPQGEREQKTIHPGPLSQGEREWRGMPGMLRGVCEAVGAEGGSGWVRLMYAYPSNFSDAMIDAFAELVRGGLLLPYIDIPLQHASDRILAAMRRNVTSAQQRRVLERLRERVPGMAIRTTFISGFPGETQRDHEELLGLVEAMRFENLGVFEYSQEAGTVAGTMERDPALAVPAEVKAARKEEIMLLQQRLVFGRNAAIASEFDEHRPAKTGRRMDVLIDRPLKAQGRATAGVGKGGQLYQGRTYFQAPTIDAVTYVQSAEKLAPGELVPCVIVGSDGYDLVARPVREVEEPGRRVGLRILK